MTLDLSLTAIAVSLSSFFVAYFSILWLIRSKPAWALDRPNSRSLHTQPVPRIGGLGLWLGVIISGLVWQIPIPIAIGGGAGMLLLVSLADDLKPQPVWLRLLVHMVAAGTFAYWLLPGFGSLAIWGAVAAIVWMTNLYNFMDGSDGLAGGMTVIGFGYFGIFALLAGDGNFAMIHFSIAAAAMAFLLHNFYPARIFLGDVGSIPLGFLAITLGIWGWTQGVWSLGLPLMVFSPFIADATVTLVKRLLAGKKIWQAHRGHYYQRIIQCGFGHRNTALAGYGLMLAVGGSALWIETQDPSVQFRMLLAWGGIYLILMIVFDCYQKNHHTRG